MSTVCHYTTFQAELNLTISNWLYALKSFLYQTEELLNNFDFYLVGQQQVPDLSQILLGEDKTHIPFNVGQEPLK